MNTVLYQATFTALRVTPLYIDVKQYPAAVRDGIVDLQKNPHTNTLNFGIPSHHPFLTLTGHFHGVSLFLCNREWTKALSQEAHAGFLKAAAKATVARCGFAAAEDTKALDRILAQGSTLAADWDRGAIVPTVASVGAEAEARIDSTILALLPG